MMENLFSSTIVHLPEERVSDAPPFRTTEIDFDAPLYVRSSDSKNCSCKVYVVDLHVPQ